MERNADGDEDATVLVDPDDPNSNCRANIAARSRAFDRPGASVSNPLRSLFADERKIGPYGKVAAVVGQMAVVEEKKLAVA